MEDFKVMKNSETGDCKNLTSRRWFLFTQETTLHGCKNITDRSKPVSVRIFWALVVLTAFGGWAYFGIDLIIQIRKFRPQTLFGLEYRKSLEFPTLTFCKICPLSIQGKNESLLFRDLLLYNSNWEVLKTGIAQNTFSDFNALNSLILSGKKINATFLQVRWNGKQLDPNNVLHDLNLIDGACFQFNDEAYQEINGSFVSDFGGPGGGLEVIVDTDQSGCPAGKFDSAGLEIYIQSPQDKTRPRSPDLVLSPGVSAYISLSKSQTLFLPYPYKAIDDKYCTESKNYSKINCIDSCVNEELSKICPCTNVTIKGKINAEECTNAVAAIVCLDSNKGNMLKSAERGDICDCPDPCIMTEYNTELSFSYFPTDSTADRLVELGQIPDQQYARKNILKFNMYFKNLAVSIVEYVPKYNSNDVLGFVGGQLGLFLGASLITATEIVEAVFMFCYVRVTNMYSSKIQAS